MTLYTPTLNFDDMVLSSQGDILLSDYDNNCIKSISTNKTVKTLFKLKWELYGLCCLHRGDIVVTFPSEGRVVIYSMSGKVIKELDKKLFTQPSWVAQSKVNSDLYISGSGKVLALNADYKARYDYTGQRGTKEPFNPCDLCYRQRRCNIK